jgi:CTP:molybdopterin cytidylyltransferase MocA
VTLLGHVLAEVAKGPFDHRFVVIGAEADRILEEVDFTDWVVVENLEWEAGLASSLRVGLDAVLRLTRADAAVIFLGDQPEVDQGVIKALLEKRTRSKRQVIVPKYRYEWGNPVVVERPLWARLMSLEGDEGAQALLKAHPEWVEEVWFEARSPRDVDTIDDIEDLRPRR